MKQFIFILIAIVLLPAVARPQALPDAPAPALPDAAWNRVEHLTDGEEIVVRTADGVLVHCRFAGATDACLFCDPPGPPLSQASYRFDRASVVSVRESLPERDHHPGLLAAVAIVGTAVGMVVAQKTDERTAMGAGILGAAFAGVAGYTMLQMQSQYAGFGFAYQPGEFRRGIAGPPHPRPHMRFPIGRTR